MAGRVPDEEHAVLGGIAQGVGDPVALIADTFGGQIAGQPLGGLAHVKAGIERPDPDAHLAVGGEAPAVPGGDIGAVDPHFQVVARAEWVNLQSAGKERVGRLNIRARAENAAPPEGIDDQGRPDVTAVGADRAPGTPVDLRGLELKRSLLGQQPAQGAVVEGRERPRKVVTDGRVGGVDDELAEFLLSRLLQPHRL